MGAAFGNVFRSLPLFPVCDSQMCFGMIGYCWNWPSTFPAGAA